MTLDWEEHKVGMFLDGETELRSALAEPSAWYGESSMDSLRYLVKSNWLIALIDEIVATGKYPYNGDVQRLAEKRLGLERQSDNGSPLSALVYNAQRYRRADMLVAAGYRPLTQEMVDEAFRMGWKVEVGSVIANPRKIGGQIYLMKPHASKRALCIHPSIAARFVKPEQKGRPVSANQETLALVTE